LFAADCLFAFAIAAPARNPDFNPSGSGLIHIIHNELFSTYLFSLLFERDISQNKFLTTQAPLPIKAYIVFKK
jgi:hypothetical protein